MSETTSRFLQLKCKCGADQTIFGSASTEVRCKSCDRPLGTPTGGKTNIHTKITKVLE